MSGGATVAPMVAPMVKMPYASPRSRTGNHSESALGPTVQLPGSPMPSSSRHSPSVIIEVANAVPMLASDHQMMNAAMLTRVPSQSVMRPETRYEMV